MFADAASREHYYFATIPWAPAPGRNVHFFAEIAATSRQEADTVMDVLRGHHEDLLRDLNPGPLPSQVENIAFWSWEIIESGPDAGDVAFFAARPGSRIVDFELQLNAFTASPGNGAVSLTLGDWQVVEVVVPGHEIRWPTTGAPVTNSFSILIDTDVGEPVSEDAEITLVMTS